MAQIVGTNDWLINYSRCISNISNILADEIYNGNYRYTIAFYKIYSPKLYFYADLPTLKLY